MRDEPMPGQRGPGFVRFFCLPVIVPARRDGKLNRFFWQAEGRDRCTVYLPTACSRQASGRSYPSENPDPPRPAQHEPARVTVMRAVERIHNSQPFRTAIFFTALFLYVHLRINPALIYYSHGQLLRVPSFFRGWEFLKQFLDSPGGPVRYLCALLSQLYYYRWAGTLVITGLAWLAYLAVGPFTAALSGRRIRILQFAPAAALLLAYNRYIHCLQSSLEILLALFFFWLYIRTRPKSAAAQAMVFVVLSVLVYYAGGSAYLLFALLCGFLELRARQFASGLWSLAAAGWLPYVLGRYLLDTGLVHPYLGSWLDLADTDLRTVHVALGSYLLVAAAAAVMSFWPRSLTAAADKNKKCSGATTRLSPLRRVVLKYQTSKVKPALQGVLLPILAVAVISFSLDENQQTWRRILYYSTHGMWQQALEEARRLPPEKYNLIICHKIDRALYHSGRMGGEMFRYPQSAAGLLAGGKLESSSALGDCLLELGLVNHAEHASYEELEVFGPHPFTLRRLALTNMAKGQLYAARTFLNLLSRCLVYGRWARDCLRQLDVDPALAGNQQIQHIRAVMVRDEPTTPDSLAGELLSRLLQNNPHNRMAFEYLMAWYLLTKQLEKFVAELGRLDDFNYPAIPRHYEEAVLLYGQLTKKDLKLGKRRIGPETVAKYHDFMYRSQPYRYDRQAAQKMLAGDFGNTYYYYYAFVRPEQAK